MPTPPSSWVAAPIYAWLVFRQKARPKHEEERLAARLSASQHEHDTAVVDLAQSLHAALLDDARYASPIAEFGRAEQAYRHLVGHTEKTEESGPVDSESAGSLPRLQAELDAGRNEREDAELGLRRVRARYQRLQIELRAAQSQGETGVDRVATIRNEMSQVLEFVAGAETRLEQAEKAHAAAQRALGATRLALRRAEDRLRAQQQRGTERHSETSQPRDAARRRVVETGYDLCRAVLLAHNRPAPDPTLVERFGRAEEELRVVLAEQSILKESARAVDEGLVRTGWVMTLGSAALICWLVWLAFR